jgi:hypothetical protein
MGFFDETHDFRDFGLPPSQSLATVLGCAVGGAFLLAIADVAYGLWFEQVMMPKLVLSGAPMKSYGQQSFIMMILAALLGAAGGASLGLAIRQRYCSSAAVGLIGCGLIGLFVYRLWSDSVRHYGPDPSDFILFWPFAFYVPAVLVLSLWFSSASALAAAVHWALAPRMPVGGADADRQ